MTQIHFFRKQFRFLEDFFHSETYFNRFCSTADDLFTFPEYFEYLRSRNLFTFITGSLSLKDLMYDTLIMAKKNNFDVFNALDLMEV